MSGEDSGGSGNALISLILSSLTPEGGQTLSQIVLYTSFGVVRGRLGILFLQSLRSRDNGGARETAVSDEVIELNDVTVEHYSNHLPTASFTRLYVRLSDAQGFALMPA